MDNANKLYDMLSAISDALKKMHDSESLNNSIAELQVHLNDEKFADEIETIVDETFNQVIFAFDEASERIKTLSKITVTDGELTPERIDEISELAIAFQNSGDELLMKQASVLDEILFTLGSDKLALLNHKKAESDEIEKLREKAREARYHQAYIAPQEELDKQNKVEATGKAVADQVKVYRSLEAPLSTRSCPEHPGAQLARIGDNTYQCSMDKKVYNYEVGYETMKGNKVPGGSVEHQTIDFGTRDEGHVIFDTREGKLS